MKILRIFTVASLLVMGANFSIMAQKTVTAPASDHRPSGYAKITEVLTDLTDVQKTKINEVEKNFETKLKAVKSDKMTTEDAKMKSIKALREEKRKEIESILTDKQKEELKAYRQENKEAKKVAQSSEERAEELVSKLDEQVKLTSEQKVKALEIAKKFITDKKAIKSNTALSEEEREVKVKELKKANKLEVSKILTKEQNDILKTKMEERKAAKK